MADVKPVIVQSNGNNSELSASDVLIIPNLALAPVGNPPAGYLYLYGLTADNSFYQKSSAGIITKLANDTGGAATTFAQSRWRFSDYDNNANGQTAPFGNLIIGTAASFNTAPIVADALHQGLNLFRSGTSANSGVRSQNISPLISAQGLIYRGIFMFTSFTLKTFRIGFLDTLTSADAIDGAYFEIAATGVCSAKTSANSVRTTAGTTFTLLINTFYKFDIEYLTATSVRLVISDDAGAKLYDTTIATNVPVGIARSFFAGMVGTNSGTVAADLCYIDYQGYGPARPEFIITPV